MVLRAAGIVPVLVLMLALPAQAGERDPAARAAQLEQRREQLRQKWERQFREADRDGDRRLDQEEVETAGLPRRLIERFAEIDADRDGGLSPEELLAVQERRIRAASEPAAPAP